jgi:hypothetical protein
MYVIRDNDSSAYSWEKWMLFFRLFLIERGENLPHAGEQDGQVRRVKGQRGTEPDNFKRNKK